MRKLDLVRKLCVLACVLVVAVAAVPVNGGESATDDYYNTVSPRFIFENEEDND